MPSAPEPSGRTTRAISANPTPPEPTSGAATRSGKGKITSTKRKQDVEPVNTRAKRSDKNREKPAPEVVEEVVEEAVEEVVEEVVEEEVEGEQAPVFAAPQVSTRGTRASKRLGRQSDLQEVESVSSDSEGEEDVAALLTKDVPVVPAEEEDQLVSDDEVVLKEKVRVAPAYPSPEREDEPEASEDDADMSDEEGEEGDAGVFTRRGPFGRTPYRAWFFPAESWVQGAREDAIEAFVNEGGDVVPNDAMYHAHIAVFPPRIQVERFKFWIEEAVAKHVLPINPLWIKESLDRAQVLGVEGKRRKGYNPEAYKYELPWNKQATRNAFTSKEVRQLEKRLHRRHPKMSRTMIFEELAEEYPGHPVASWQNLYKKGLQVEKIKDRDARHRLQMGGVQAKRSELEAEEERAKRRRKSKGKERAVEEDDADDEPAPQSTAASSPAPVSSAVPALVEDLAAFFASTAQRTGMQFDEVKGTYFYCANSRALTSQACSLISRNKGSSEAGKETKRAMWSPKEDEALFEGKKHPRRGQEEAKNRRRYIHQLREEFPELVNHYPW